MRIKATISSMAYAMLVIGLFVGVQDATAQAPVLGDEFIFFVNGPNVLIPAVDPEIVNDPLDPTNKVAKFADADWSHTGFRWDRAVGVDMSANVGDTGTGDTLYIRLLSDPLNVGQTGVNIIFTDKTDDSAATREDLESGAATGDLEFRAIWPIPDSLSDGLWHDLKIPLPPATWANLEAAKDGGSLDPYAANWSYQGAWATAGFGVGTEWGSGDDPTVDLLWHEFEWDAVKTFGIILDNATPGGTVYYDDIYIGNGPTDLSVASDPSTPMGAISVATDGGTNVISWTHNPDFGGYNVYASESAITDVSAEGVSKLATVAFNAPAFELRHTIEIPHPSLGPLPLFYAVTSLSQFGVENDDISASTGSVENNELAAQPFILELTTEESDQLFDNLSGGVASSAGFPDIPPFVLNQANGFPTAGGPAPSSDTDLSAKVWVGYTSAPELFIYAEITDDMNVFSPEIETGGTAWQWDSIEMGWGSYDVRDAGGSLLGGSPHSDFGREAAPDYQMRFGAFVDATGNQVRTTTFASSQFNSLEGEVVGGASVVEPLEDGSSNVIGWKILTLVPLDQIAFDGTGDQVFTPPASDEIVLVPLNFAVNDADATGVRESQILSTKKPNADGNWWNTPAQWTTVAVVGRALAVANELVENNNPDQFQLDANFPNPFSERTSIRFALPNSERVTLDVYNVLGQRVARLVDGELMGAGTHSVGFSGRDLAAGTYFYRIEAGADFVQARSMVLIK